MKTPLTVKGSIFGYHLEEIKLYAEGNSIVIEQDGYLDSWNGVVINDEPSIICSSVEIDNTPKASNSSDKDLVRNSEACQIFDAEIIIDIPQYIDNMKKVDTYSETFTINGKE